MIRDRSFLARGVAVVGIGLHATYAVVATGALLASLLFIHAVVRFGSSYSGSNEGATQAA